MQRWLSALDSLSVFAAAAWGVLIGVCAVVSTMEVFVHTQRLGLALAAGVGGGGCAALLPVIFAALSRRA